MARGDGSRTTSDAVAAALDRLAHLDPVLGWMVAVRHEALDELQPARGPLAGVPVVVKDVLVDHDRPPTAGSAAHATWLRGTAPALVRLRARGAAVVGYSNLQEWCLGTISAVSAYGPIRNPWDPELIAGGSSGGSAACVAAGLVPAALGSDAGGSVRVPAACCGVVGFKPTFGRVSTEGFVGDGCPIDHLGCLARSVQDVETLFRVLASDGRHDARRPGDPSGLRVGVARPHFFDDLEPHIRSSIEDAVNALRPAVAAVEDVTVEGAERARRAVSAIMLPFVAERLRDVVEERPDRLRPETLGMLRRGLAMSPSRRRDASEVVRDVSAGWARVFHTVDVVVTPTLAQAPPRLDAGKDALESVERGHLALNAPMNLAGVPALSVPCGDLGASLTFTAARGRDAVALALGKRWEALRGPLWAPAAP